MMMSVTALILATQLIANTPAASVLVGVSSAAPEKSSQQLLELAVRNIKAGRNSEGITSLAALMDRAPEYELDGRYYIAKALYREGFYHAALIGFEDLMSRGPKNRYFQPALEWSLFVGRKMTNDVFVNEAIARHGREVFPERYRDEFLFRLARYYYGQGLILSATEAQRKEPEASPNKAISFEEDLFASDRPKPKRKKAKKRRKKKKGRLSIEDNLFDEQPAQPVEKAKPQSVAPREKTAQTYWEAARRLIIRVSKGSDYYIRAKYMEGLLLYQSGEANEALAAFKEVIESTKKGLLSETSSEKRRRLKLRELAFFQVARLHFGASQPSFSIFYYRKIDRDSMQWLDSLYESSWAEYRLGRHEKALGNLLTVHAPFFEDAHYPESTILKAVIYYENCRYKDAGDIVASFLGRYTPISKRLEQLINTSKKPDEWYALLESYRSSNKAGLSEEIEDIVAVALKDPELGNLDATLLEILDEIKRLEAAYNGDGSMSLKGVGFIDRTIQELKARAEALKAKVGRSVRRRLKKEFEYIQSLQGQAYRIQVETAKAEEGRLEASLSRRKQRPKSVVKSFVEWTDDEKLIWPFEGEYWRDELGTYELTLGHSCR